MMNPWFLAKRPRAVWCHLYQTPRSTDRKQRRLPGAGVGEQWLMGVGPPFGVKKRFLPLDRSWPHDARVD
jgi:hypothetical protein